MEIYLYSFFIKRENSTKQPPDDNLVYKTEGTLKNPTSVINPVITVQYAVDNYFYRYNYAYLPDFHRYYFIDDIVSDGYLWTISMHVDVLASYKDQIKNAALYMLRSSTRYNGLIADTYYPVTFNRKAYVTRLNTLWTFLTDNSGDDIDVTKGSFILGIVAKPSGTGKGSYGSIRYYALKQDQLLNLVTALLDNSIADNVNGFSANDATISLQKGLLNPLSYIKSCMWLPVSYNNIPGTVQSSLNVWDWNLSGVSSKLLTTNTPYYETEQIGVTLHNHPQAITRGKYLNTAPYTKISLLYPPFGLFEIDTTEMVDGSSLNIKLDLDYITGLGTLDIFADIPDSSKTAGASSNLILLQRIKSQIGVSIQLSEVGYDYTNMALTLVGGGVEMIQAKFSQYLDSSISNSLSQIGSAVNAMRTKASTIGSNGGFSELAGYVWLFEEYWLIANEDLAHIGRPLCEMVRLAEESNGYYLARSGEIEIRYATFPEMNQIKSYLEGGFYYE